MSRTTTVQLFVLILLLFLIIYGFLKIFGPIPFTITSTNTNKTDNFTVSGMGEIQQIPDTAVISLGVRSQANTVKQTQDSLNSSINQVTDAIKNLGISSDDIQTQNYTLNPTYQDLTNPQVISGYQADTTLRVKIPDTSKLNSVIDAATKSGANQIGGIEFTINDPTAAQNQARSKAVAQAKARAEAIASTAGFSLGRLVNYSENLSPSSPIPLSATSFVEKSLNSTTQIQPGTNTIQVQVFLSYEIY